MVLCQLKVVFLVVCWQLAIGVELLLASLSTDYFSACFLAVKPVRTRPKMHIALGCCVLVAVASMS